MKYQIQKLEALRGFAAVYVLLHHVSSSYLGYQKKIYGFPFRFGQEAVMVFFILSGFVIHYSLCNNTSENFKIYFFKRTKRIYPIYILALILSYIIYRYNLKGDTDQGNIFGSFLGN